MTGRAIDSHAAKLRPEQPVIHPRDWPDYRRDLGWSQAELGRRAGISASKVGQYEREWDMMRIDQPTATVTARANGCHVARVLWAAWLEQAP